MIFGLGAGTLDFVTLVFCLSAISPDHFPGVIARLSKLLKPGGMMLIRDYGLGDLAEERFAKEAADKKLGDNFYVRSVLSPHPGKSLQRLP